MRIVNQSPFTGDPLEDEQPNGGEPAIVSREVLAPRHRTSEGSLLDRFGRPMKSLRLSVTDRCNFSCTYCMPEGGPETHSSSGDVLSYEELTHLTRMFIDLGVDNVRITGGEPLLRKELHKLIEQLQALPGLNEVTLTTNGFLLAEQIDALQDAGLDRVNISLDTFEAEKFNRITKSDGYARVMEGLEALLEHPRLHPMKLNVVAIKGFNDDELTRFAHWAAETGQTVRFIEFMPLEKGYSWSEEKLLLAPEMREILSRDYELKPLDGNSHAPATTFQLSGTDGRVGFIPSISNPFCGTCDRVRLTADGQLKNCLFSYDEHDLREALRSGAPPRALKSLIAQRYRTKWEGGCVKLKKGTYDPQKQSRSMSRIGG